MSWPWYLAILSGLSAALIFWIAWTERRDRKDDER